MAAANDFQSFLTARRSDLSRIASRTGKDLEIENVESEAWLLSQTLPDRLGRGLDLHDSADQDLLVAYLYNQLVKFTETTVRYAARLDDGGSDDGDGESWLVRNLAAAESSDPLKALEAAEERPPERPDPNPHSSIAAAWVRLLQIYDNDMLRVADHLRISLSYCYLRFRVAKTMAENQVPLAPKKLPSARRFLSRPWRLFRLPRRTEQLELDLTPSLFE